MSSAPQPTSLGDIQGISNNLAQEQQLSNEAAQAGSNYFQANPYGSVAYNQTGTGPNGVPLYSATQQFSPAQQGLYDQFTAGQMMEGDIATNMLANMNYPQNMPQQTIGGMTSGYTGQMMDQYAAGVQPFFKLQNEQAQANLENQGFSPTSSGYYAGMLPIATGQASALSSAESNFMPQAYQMAANNYTMPYNWAAQSLPLSGPVSPNAMFTGGASLQPTNNIGAYGTTGGVANQQYANQLSAYNANQAVLSGLLGSAGMLGVGLGNIL